MLTSRPASFRSNFGITFVFYFLLSAQAGSDEITKFGNSYVKTITQNGSTLLALLPDDMPLRGPIPQLILQCFSYQHTMSLMLPFLNREKPRFGPQRITIWSDLSDPQDLTVVGVKSGLLGLATTDDDRFFDAVRSALDAVENAQTYVAYSDSEITGTIKSEHLPAARGRFRQICRQ